MTRYLITSGNSKVGRAAIRALRALGETDIVAGARKPVESEEALKKAGASTVVEFDFDKPDTVVKALERVERVLIVHAGQFEPTVLTRWAQTVVDAATRPGSTVKVLGKIAAVFADSKSDVPIPKAHGQVLEIFAKSGLLHFSIGPTFNFENWFMLKKDILSGVVTGAAGDTKSAYVAVDDIGAAAISALNNPEKYNGRHIHLTGEVLNEAAVLKAITDATGIHATYNSVSPADFEAFLKQRNVPPPLVVMNLLWESLKRSGRLSGFTTDVLKELLGREPITANAWAATNASYFKN